MSRRKWNAWRRESSDAAKVSLDAGIIGCFEQPDHPGYAWARASIGEKAVPPKLGELFPGGWEAVAKARGDLTQVEPTLIPDGGVFCFPKAFAIGKYLVTQRIYSMVMNYNPSDFKTGPDAPERPVEHVSWFDAVVFCNRLSELLRLNPVYITRKGEDPEIAFHPSNNGYRLPTEAEWEYAARGKEEHFAYAGSNNLDEVGWYIRNSDHRTHRVGEKKPNGFGLYDMTGNVSEWIQEVHHTSPSLYLVCRGGNFLSSYDNARIDNRDRNPPQHMSACTGFRLARTIALPSIIAP